MQYGCIGERLTHSFSAEIHRALADYSYEIREVEREELASFLQKKEFCGINVTIPYKEAVMPHLFWISDQAREIGAVNTVVNRDGRLYGYNTDFYGMQALIGRLGIQLRGKKLAVLGSGGTSRTAVAVARSLGADPILCVGRRQKEGVIDYEALYREHADVQVLINTTPCGMYPYANGSKTTPAVAVDVSRLAGLEGVIDAVYNPLRTQLVLDARARGIAAEGGLYMLVAQAMRASEIFLDKTYPQGTLDAVFEALLREKENVVLSGMPGSGKSTVGRLLAKRLNRRLLELDEEIEREAGRSISRIFEEMGEPAFRDMETAIIRERAAQQNGLVISLGGGAVLREENVNALRKNGRICFIDRPLEALLPTPDRPLASSAEAIRKRYKERYAIYLNTADRRVAVTGEAESVADEIERDWKPI